MARFCAKYFLTIIPLNSEYSLLGEIFCSHFQERERGFGGEIKLVKVWQSRASHAGPLLLPHGSGERTEKQPLRIKPNPPLYWRTLRPRRLGDLSKSFLPVWGLGVELGLLALLRGVPVSSQVIIGTLPWVVNRLA